MTLSSHVFFFDIDNCLYSPTVGIIPLTKARIHAYGCSIGIDPKTVKGTCESYYKAYGLTIRGFIKHHGINPLDYNAKVDGSLPLETVIQPDLPLREMLQRIKMRRWAFTNAGIDHAQRVLRCLGIEDMFEGITFCDYLEEDFACKPAKITYERAMQEAGVSDPKICYFVDDSMVNVVAAQEMGWTAVHVSPTEPILPGGIPTIHDLPLVLPHIFE
ncbi:suppressor of deletion of TFIIS [Kickxella alabastrina]|uniref:Suppressor of deletion of TFIIS n=1 Tax=Kickxella alabastrina TaxID=61397 RepID=A0ACC1ILM4_9FUNG|nr:suppressor of deletion of TFIIS [Kickxella alabastrina]